MDQQYTEPVGDSWKYNPDYHRTADYLGLDIYDRNDIRVAEKISSLHDWASGADPNVNLDNVLEKIHELKRDLGISAQGKILIDELYKNIRLKSAITEQKKIKEKQKAAEPKKIEPQKDLTKVVEKSVQNRINKVVEKTFQDRIQSIIDKAMNNKNVIYKSIDKAIDNIIK